jgi:uncharacterized protein (DUF362 family)
MRRLTRREFLTLGAGATVAAGASQLLTGCDGDGGTAPVETVTPVPTLASESSARVAAIRGSDLDSMTRDALDAVGGVEKIVNPGETVFIKPNMVTLPFAPGIGNPFLTGDCTKPEIVVAVTEECLRAGAAEVIIGDGSQLPSFSWENATTLDGATNLAAEGARLSSEYEGKVTLACLEADSPDWVEVPTSAGMGNVAVSSLLAGADRVISIPVMKTHQWAHLSLSLKNFVGVTPLERYVTEAYPVQRVLLDHSSPETIAQIYLDIIDAVKPDLAIIDASIGVEGNGPTIGEGGQTVDMKDRLGSWLLLAGTDLVAADATAARVMSHDVAEMSPVVMGYEMGLGEMREESIEVVGERLDDLRVDWLPATLLNAASREAPHYGPHGMMAHIASPTR